MPGSRPDVLNNGRGNSSVKEEKLSSPDIYSSVVEKPYSRITILYTSLYLVPQLYCAIVDFADEKAEIWKSLSNLTTEGRENSTSAAFKKANPLG